MPFIDIAFQAEISRYEDVEFDEYAKRNCNERPDTRSKAITELRQTISDGDCKIRRTDDAYLLRFLRARYFSPHRAYRLMRKYEEFRKKNSHLYEGVDPFQLTHIRGLYEGVYPDSPDNGRITIIKFGMWDPKTMTIDDVTRCAVAMNEICIMQPKIQVLGVTVIIDLEGLSMRHIPQLTPNMANQMVSLLGASFPVHVHGIHVINYSWIINTALYVFKPFIPGDAWSRVHFHGSDVTALHQYINPAYLPHKYGGTCQFAVPANLWLEKINKYKDDFLVEELKALGYVINI